MAADPDTLVAINALADNLRNAVDGRLNVHREEMSRAQRETQDRVESHARESREMMAEQAAEFRAGIKAIEVAMASFSTQLNAHIDYDERQFERHDRELDTVRSKAHELAGKVDALKDSGAGDNKKIWNLLAWLFGALGFGTGAWSKWGGGGQ